MCTCVYISISWLLAWCMRMPWASKGFAACPQNRKSAAAWHQSARYTQVPIFLLGWPQLGQMNTDLGPSGKLQHPRNNSPPTPNVRLRIDLDAPTAWRRSGDSRCRSRCRWPETRSQYHIVPRSKWQPHEPIARAQISLIPSYIYITIYILSI